MGTLSVGRNVWRHESPALQSRCSCPLIYTKLAVQPTPSTYIARARLVAELNKGSEYKLTLISAPTGFGKTTLLSEWANQSPLSVVWLTLNNSENEPAQFWFYLIVALASLLEQSMTDILKRFSPDYAEATFAEIIYLIANVPQDFVLVLDDYHTIHNPLVHAIVTQLLEYTPDNLHLFIASRTRPPLKFGRLRAYGHLYELNMTALLFTPEEIERFLTHTLNMKPSPEQIALLKAQTEGWVAILRLIIGDQQEKTISKKAPHMVAIDSRHIHEYLCEEILHCFPQHIQSFLLRSSILTHLTPPLCNVLTETSDSSLLLQELERANLFFTSAGIQQNRYAYPQILRAFLFEHLKRMSPALVPLLHRRASFWYKKHEHYNEALHHALVAQTCEKNLEKVHITKNSLPEELLHVQSLRHQPIQQKKRNYISQEGTVNKYGVLEVHPTAKTFPRDHVQAHSHSDSLQLQTPSLKDAVLYDFSERELSVLRGIARGLSNQDIAQEMIIAESTVKWHVKNIYSKLQVHSRAQAIIKTRNLQLI